MKVHSREAESFRRQEGRPEKTAASFPGRSPIWINLSGVLSALVIAFGGWFLVQEGLAMEEKKLLSGGGMEELHQGGTVEAAESRDISVLEPLTEEELVQVINALENREEILPHEPGREQLSMTEAIQCGMHWMELFLMPHLGVSGFSYEEYRISCYLWRPEPDTAEGAGTDRKAVEGAGTDRKAVEGAGTDRKAAEGADADRKAAEGTDAESAAPGETAAGEVPWLSCWTIAFSSEELEVRLILNAVSGQVLDASIKCASPVEYQDRELLMALLEEYAHSFGLEGDYTLVYSGESKSGAKKLPWYQSVGTRGLFAAIQADSIAVSLADVEASEYAEYLNIHLYLMQGL
ncbi:MAG: hypothetical protein NC123_14665 [Butyrivibrio sp.]|nr:hypothetical protein [Acetatifactor muris]MCM1560761.1 hypothetical protein [Butyrivibrio sp.]